MYLNQDSISVDTMFFEVMVQLEKASRFRSLEWAQT